jgi:hypothetical protein
MAKYLSEIKRELNETPVWKHGHELHPEDQNHVLRAYVHRYTGTHKPEWANKSRPDGSKYMPQHKDDHEWLKNTRFAVKKNGRLDQRVRRAESNPTWPHGSHEHGVKESIVTDQEIDSLIVEGGPTRKHFRQVASIIAQHPDAAKRKELADHHAHIFAAQNPRFNHQIWKKACNVNEEVVNEAKKHDADGKILHKSTYYFKTPEHAHAYATKHGYPTHRILAYGKGHAVQGGVSGDYAGPHGLKVGDWPHQTLKPLVKEDQDLDAIYDGQMINEGHDEHGAHELVLHADNDSHLYHSSHVPVAKNLERKYKKGIYDSEKAKKLWKYHADRAAQSYHHEHGDPHSKWHHAFSPATRHEAAAHWEKHHRAEMEAGNFHESVEHGGELVVEVTEHDLMSRPDLHAAREHFKKGIEHSRKHSELVQAAHKKYGDGNGTNISGIHREHYPEHVKNELRHHAHSVSHHNDLGMKARPKGVRHSTMVKLGQTVAKHHGPTGFYGFQPR